MKDSLVVIGRFGKAFGIRGWINLNSFSNPKENILNFQSLKTYRNGLWQDIIFEQTRESGKNLVVKIDNCNDRDQAASYTNCDIFVLREHFPQTNENEYYWTDLEGLNVIDSQDQLIGKVDYLFSTASNDVLVVKKKAPNEKKQSLIPFIKNFVLDVDIKNAFIKVDWDPEF